MHGQTHIKCLTLILMSQYCQPSVIVTRKKPFNFWENWTNISSQIADSLKLPLTARAITDALSKSWLLAVYHDVNKYEQFREKFTNLFSSKPRQSRIRCAIYQDKYSRQEFVSMTAHFFICVNLATSLQPPISEDVIIRSADLSLLCHCAEEHDRL